MKMSKKATALISALALTALCVGAAMAATGDSSDPLVTVSYLKQKTIPEIVAQVETKAAARQKALQTALNDQVTTYRQEIEKKVGSGGSNSGASYTVVTLTSGHTMRLGEGCEVMLRSGAAKVTSSGSPALVDMSTGAELNSGAALTKNHLYMAVGAEQVITPTTAPVKLMARGIYTIT